MLRSDLEANGDEQAPDHHLVGPIEGLALGNNQPIPHHGNPPYDRLSPDPWTDDASLIGGPGPLGVTPLTQPSYPTSVEQTMSSDHSEPTEPMVSQPPLETPQAQPVAPAPTTVENPPDEDDDLYRRPRQSFAGKGSRLAELYHDSFVDESGERKQG
jgi:hypothetical protein